MRALTVPALGALLLAGCAGDPTLNAGRATNAPATSTSAIAEPDRAFPLASTIASTDADSPPRAVVVRPGAGCILATWAGTLGNCVAPSIVVQDRCAKVEYVILYNACSRTPMDTRLLDGTGRPPAGLLRFPAGASVTAHTQAAVAIRGRIDRGFGTSAATFDVEADFPDVSASGAPLTVHLVGATSP